MNEQQILKQWLSVFGKGVDPQLIEEHVTSYGNLLWHLFTWGNVPCLKGDAAREAFDRLPDTEIIKFYDGYAGHIVKVSVCPKVSAKKLDREPNNDIYLVAKDFSWTYVRTHETDWLGPYFCKKEP